MLTVRRLAGALVASSMVLTLGGVTGAGPARATAVAVGAVRAGPPATAASADTVGAAVSLPGSQRVALVLGSAEGAAGNTVVDQLAAQPLSTDPIVRAQQLAGRRAALAAAAPSATSFTTVATWAAAHGLSVESHTSDTVTLDGPATSLAGLFDVHLTTVRYRTATDADSPTAAPLTTGTAHTGELAVPSGLAGVVTGAVGIDDRPTVVPHVTDTPLDPGAFDGPKYTSRFGGEQYPGATGAGVRVGIIGYFDPGAPASQVSLSDFHTYAAAAGITPPDPVDAHASPQSIFSDPDASNDEAMLDLESVVAVAPQAQTVFYLTSGDDAGVLSGLSQMADAAAAGQLPLASDSYGSCEPYDDQINAEHQEIARFTAAGSTFLSGSGDSGAFDCDNSQNSAADNTHALTVDYPPSDPLVVAVGGTTDVAGQPSTGWGNTTDADTYNNFSGYGSGGGVSRDFGVPSWQAGVSGVLAGGRNVPDISAPADFRTGGFETYRAADTGDIAGSPGWVETGGTSLSAPLITGWMADALSLDNRPGLAAAPGFGDIHAELYANPQVFTDVTSGNNFHYSAGPGYDQVTGLGVPNLPLFTNLLIGAPFPDPVIQIAAMTTTATTPVSVPAAGDRRYTAFRLTVGADSCATPPTAPGSALPASITLPALGPNLVTLVSEDEFGGCHVSQTTITYTLPAPAVPAVTDHTAPTVTLKLTQKKNTQLASVAITVNDAGSGVKSLLARVVDLDTGHVALTIHNPGLYSFSAAGGRYAVTATATDEAGNQTRTLQSATIDPGVDDRQLSRHGSWVSSHVNGALDATVSTSRRAGSSLSTRYTVGGHGQKLTIFGAGGSGLARVTVDGKLLGLVHISRRHIAIGKHVSVGKHVITLTLVSGSMAIDGLQIA